MKTVSTAFKDAQKSPAAVSVRRVSYKRRYWVESSKAYTWESSWTVLPEDQVVSVSPITGKLDTDKLNEFKISNVNLVLKNERRQWKAGKRGGYFGATDTYPNGFEPYWTKFQIESGYLVSGVATYVPMFVGVAIGFSTAAASDTIQIDVNGLESLLQNANAENVSTYVENETPTGTVNGTNKDFITIHPGVGIIVKVTVAGAVKKAGTDYNISDLDTPTLGAKISFVSAPTTGQTVNVWYKYWKQNQTMQSLVSDLAIEAGIPISKQSIQPVAFGGQFPFYGTHLGSDWAIATKTDSTSSLISSTLCVDMASSTFFTLLDTFSGDLSHWNGDAPPYDNLSIVSGQMKMALNKGEGANPRTGSAKYTSGYNALFGSWEFKFTLSNTDIKFGFYAGGYNVDYNGVSFRYAAYPEYWNWSPDTSQHTIKTIFYANGTAEFYFDGVLRFTNTSVTNNIYIYDFYIYATSPNTARYIYLDDLKGTNTSISGSAITKTFDLATPPATLGKITPTIYNNLGGVTFETSSSSDGSSWDSWIITDGGYHIKSTPRRYLRFRTTLTNNATVSNFTFEYTATSTSILLAKFTDLSCYSAISSFGSFSNYEWGFNEQEIFFFRPKQADKTIDEVLDGSINVVDVSSLSDGVDRVYSEVQATYGAFDVIVGDDGLTKDGPISRYGKRRLTIDGGDILIAPDADVASGIASLFYSTFNEPRMTMKAKTKLMEWLDLSDTVSLTFNDNIPARPWSFGDTSAYFGDKTLYFFGDADQTAKGMLCKVVGYRHDTENKISEFDLEEIL